MHRDCARLLTWKKLFAEDDRGGVGQVLMAMAGNDTSKVNFLTFHALSLTNSAEFNMH